MKNADPLAYSIPSFCQAVNIGRTKAYEEIKLGRLQVIKFGSRTLIPRENAEAWLARLADEQVAA